MLTMAALILMESEAQAGFAINTGMDIIRVSDIKDEHRAQIEAETAPDVAIGVAYNRFGFFGIDLLRWDKKFVLFADVLPEISGRGLSISFDTWELPKSRLDEIAKDGVDAPFSVTMPTGLMVLLFGGFAWGVDRYLSAKKRQQQRASASPVQSRRTMPVQATQSDNSGDTDYPPL